MRKIKNSKKGFTLLELLVVVLIIGILAGIALPQYKKIILKANLHKGISFVASLYQAQQLYYLNHSTFAKNLTGLDITLPDGCTDTGISSGYMYKCSFGRFYCDDTDSANIYFLVPKQTISYVKYLKDTENEPANITFKAGQEYCFARPNNQIAQDVCQNMGGTYIGELNNVWKYYELK